MRKKIYALFISFVLVFLLAGCQGASNDGNDGTLPPNPTPSNTSPVNIEIERATDKLLSKYDSVYEYIKDEDGIRLMIHTDTPLKDFAFISVDYVDKEGEFYFVEGSQLFQIDELSPEKPFVVQLQIAGSIPNYGISFVDENGDEKNYIISYSGRGEDEAPPFSLLEFEKANSK
ncbi:MAG: hypothetical protein PHX63_05555 [Eubacteriales bacterium]|nr:hypothetical protein [Eubacteriales bacterium]